MWPVGGKFKGGNEAGCLQGPLSFESGGINAAGGAGLLESQRADVRDGARRFRTTNPRVFGSVVH